MSRADKTCREKPKTFSPFSVCETSLISHPTDHKHHISPSPSPYVVMFEEAQHPQLSEDPLTGDQVLEDIGHLLQSHLATVTWIGN